jgi:hypothetical protein
MELGTTRKSDDWSVKSSCLTTMQALASVNKFAGGPAADPRRPQPYFLLWDGLLREGMI